MRNLFVAIALLCCAPAFAVPAISSVTPSGGGIVIVGTGFGTKTNVAPFFWQDYTSGATYNDFGYSANQNAYGSSSASTTYSASTAQTRVSGKKALLWDMVMSGVIDDGDHDQDYFPHLVVRTSNTGAGSMSADDLYVSYYFKLVRVSGTNSSAIQLKGPRSGSGTDAVDNYDSYPRYVPHLWLAGDTSYLYPYQEAVDVTGTTSTGEHYNFDAGPPWNTGGWNFLEVRMHLNSVGVADGYIQWWINGKSMATNSDSSAHPSYDQILVRGSGDGALHFNFAAMCMGLDFDHFHGVNANYRAVFSEHFVDTTFQRVVVTNNSAYPSASEFDMQYPTAWTSTSVTIGTLNQGNLAAGSTAYVFVCDAAGACNATGSSFTVPTAGGTDINGSGTGVETGSNTAAGTGTLALAGAGVGIETIASTAAGVGTVAIAGSGAANDSPDSAHGTGFFTAPVQRTRHRGFRSGFGF